MRWIRSAHDGAVAGNSPFTYCCQRFTSLPRSLPVTRCNDSTARYCMAGSESPRASPKAGTAAVFFDLAQRLGRSQPHVGVHVAPQRLGEEFHGVAVATPPPRLACSYTDMGIGIAERRLENRVGRIAGILT